MYRGALVLTGIVDTLYIFSVSHSLVCAGTTFKAHVHTILSCPSAMGPALYHVRCYCIFAAHTFQMSCSFVLILFALVSNAQTENITITVPDGTTNHGDPHVLCTPTAWTDIASFFLANFVAHAATVKSKPGEPILPTIIALLAALLFPTSGVLRRFAAIWQSAIFGRNSLEKAARSGGALYGCQVFLMGTTVRGPRTGRELSNAWGKDKEARGYDGKGARTATSEIHKK